jgi:hypothetical protein
MRSKGSVKVTDMRRAEAERLVRNVRTESETAQAAAAESVGVARAEAQVAQESASRAMARTDVVIAAIRARVNRTSRLLANATYWAGVALLVAAATLAVPGVTELLNPTGKLVSIVLAVVAAALGLYGGVRGGSLLSLRDALQLAITRRLEGRWLDEPLKQLDGPP